MPIIHDAAVATAPIAEGRLVPVLIVDATERPDIVKLVQAHEHYDQGDASLQWGRLYDAPDTVALFIDFKRPVETFVILQFDIAKQGAIVDQILRSRGLYLQLGKQGDRLIGNDEAQRVRLDVPELGFDAEWEDLFLCVLAKECRANGVPRRKAKTAAKKVLAVTRKTFDIRMKS